MARYDLYHEPVRKALVKDQWNVTHNLFTFQQEAVKEVVAEFQIRLLVFDPSTETIITWIN